VGCSTGGGSDTAGAIVDGAGAWPVKKYRKPSNADGDVSTRQSKYTPLVVLSALK
jgi:hypothetical protein